MIRLFAYELAAWPVEPNPPCEVLEVEEPDE